MAAPHALISGAGIGGPAAALCLGALGWRTTLVERAPRLRDEGQNVDIRDSAREVVRRLGLEEAIRRASTTEEGFRLLRVDGSIAASFPVDHSGRTDGPTADMEILRGDLTRILADGLGETVRWRFGRTLTALDDRGDHVATTLDDGTCIDADIVVVAEGLRGTSRALIGADPAPEELGVYFAYLTVPRLDGDSRWWEWTHVVRSRGVHLRPDDKGTTRVVLTFVSDVRGLETLGREDQIRILRRTFADVGGAAPRILDALDGAAESLYFDAVGRRRDGLFSRGRVALVGDAAFCNATFGGFGTSLALVGAYVLAAELSRTEDHRDALAAYGRAMEARTGDVPAIGARTLRLANPATAAGIRALHTAAALAGSRPVTALRGLFGGTSAKDEAADLPDGPRLAAADVDTPAV